MYRIAGNIGLELYFATWIANFNSPELYNLLKLILHTNTHALTWMHKC